MAAVIAFDFISTSNQQQIIEFGREVERASFATNMEALLAQSNQSSFIGLEKLRENVANQIVNNAAKGTASGAGSAFGQIQKSESAFGQDERVRKINLLSKQASLTANSSAAQLGAISSQTQLSQALASRTFKTATDVVSNFI